MSEPDVVIAITEPVDHATAEHFQVPKNPFVQGRNEPRVASHQVAAGQNGERRKEWAGLRVTPRTRPGGSLCPQTLGVLGESTRNRG